MHAPVFDAWDAEYEKSEAERLSRARVSEFLNDLGLADEMSEIRPTII